MTPDERRLKEIEELEGWLAGAGLEVEPSGGLQRVKQRVRGALNEAWLANRDPSPPVAADLDRVKARLRAELSSQAARLAARPSGSVYRFVSTFAAAASLVLAAGLAIWTSSSPDRISPPTQPGSQDGLLVVLSRSFDEEEAEWQAIADEISVVEATLACSLDSGWNEALLDELDTEIDDLMNELNLAEEVL